MKYVKLALSFGLSVFVVLSGFSAPTIDVSWFSQNDLLNVQNAAKECTYGDRLTVPSSNPVRSGYDFNGWTVGYRDMCSLRAPYEVFADGGEGSGSGFSPSYDTNSWAQSLDYGVITGEFLCSVDTGTTAVVGNPSCTAGNGCWCRVNSYTDKDSNYLIGGPWVFLTTIGSGDCKKECPEACSVFDKIADGRKFRAALYNMVIEDGEVEVLGFLSQSGTIKENETVFDLTEPNTWGALFTGGKVVGKALCSTTTGTAATAGNPSESSGGNCWCRATGYIPSGGTLRTTSSTQWVFQSNLGTDCKGACADNCGKVLKNTIAYVPVILTGVSTSYYPSVLSTLSVVSNGVARAAKSLADASDKATGGATTSTYGLTMAGEWGTSFSYGAVRGTSLCSSATGTQYAIGLPNLTQRGSNCWCRVTGYTPRNGQAQTISTSAWVYGRSEQNTATCEANCAYWCSGALNDVLSARVAMFEQPSQESVASMSGFISDYTVLSENVNSFNLTAPGTWGADFGDNKIIGASMCDSVAAFNKGEIGNPSGDNNGDSCWCRVTDYVTSGGSSVSATDSSWVFAFKSSNCRTECASVCVNDFVDIGSTFHQNLLFGVRASNPTGSCVPVPYLWSVDTSIDGDESGSLGNNGTTHSNEVTYDLTNPGTWGVTFDYGVVLGESSCNAIFGSNQSSVSGANTMSTTDTGRYCWCRVTEHNPDDGNPIQSLTSSSWVFLEDFGANNVDGCASRCASRCATLVYGESVVRDALYTNTGL